MRKPWIVCLSNVYDERYHDARGEPVERGMSIAKRRDLFRCLELATGREVVVLSSPPKARDRRSPKWLPELETRFSSHRQIFCPNWDVPRLRILFAWFFYARHVLGHTRSGDIVLIDNYEFLYVIAAWFVRLFRRVTFVLDYEDGKHLIDRSYHRLLSGFAEMMGRPLLRAAILAHPGLGARLPRRVRTELAPGFVVRDGTPRPPVASPIRFIYSGTLDTARGVDLLLDALELLPAEGWHLDLTGNGPLSADVHRATAEARFKSRVAFHGALPGEEFGRLLSACHVGLNLQRTTDPISSVTFPSKVFTYLSAGLVVLSSRASKVDEICGDACLYCDLESTKALAAAMTRLVDNFPDAVRGMNPRSAEEKFSMTGTAGRLRELLAP